MAGAGLFWLHASARTPAAYVVAARHRALRVTPGPASPRIAAALLQLPTEWKGRVYVCYGAFCRLSGVACFPEFFPGRVGDWIRCNGMPVYPGDPAVDDMARA